MPTTIVLVASYYTDYTFKSCHLLIWDWAISIYGVAWAYIIENEELYLMDEKKITSIVGIYSVV